MYIEGDGSYSKITTVDEEIIVSKNIKYLETVLIEKSNFLRVHRYFLNINDVQNITKGDPGMLDTGTAINIPMSIKVLGSLLKPFGIS